MTLILFYFIAKWLTKADLGVFREYSIIMGFVTLVGLLSLDFHYIIEQKKTASGLFALWQLTVITSVVGFILLSLGAGLLGLVYKSEILAKLFRYTSVFFIVEVLRRTVRSIATKRLQFKEMAVAETLNVVFYSIVSLAALYFYRSIWVFLIVFYLGNTVELLYLWLRNNDIICKVLRNLFSKGKSRLLLMTLCVYRTFLTQATLVSVINQVASNAPILILGLMVNPMLIGLYFFASQLIGVPVGMFTTAINQVFFPVFAGKKDGDIGNMSSRYVRLVGSLGLPLLLVFSFVTIYATDWLFGGKWNEAIPLIMPMFILFGSGLYCTPLGGIPFIKRKPSWELFWNIGGLVLKVGAMFIGLRQSFELAIWLFAIAGAVTHLAFYVIAMLLVRQNLFDTMLKVLGSLIPTLILSGLIFFVMHLQPWIAIVSVVLGCGALWTGLNMISKGMLISDLRMLTNFRPESK